MIRKSQGQRGYIEPGLPVCGERCKEAAPCSEGFEWLAQAKRPRPLAFTGTARSIH